MSRRLITVLYEDEHARGQKHFGPHMLLLACVADRTQRTRFALLNIVAPIASGGDGNVKKKLREVGQNLAARGPLIAMFDNDKVRSCYALSSGACKRDLLVAVRTEAQGSPIIVLLEQNMEDLVGACCAAMKRPVPAGKPKPAERDGILQDAAADGQRTARDAILTAMPSFGRLVDIVERHLTVEDIMGR